jgi:glycosyltransferase involved in cell wall biosynthesis
MRIGIDIREFEKEKSTGIGRYLRQFLLYVSKHDQKNTYILFGNNKTDFTPLDEKQKLHILPVSITLLWDQFVLPKALKEKKIDVFLTPYFKAPIFMPCKLVVIINDLIPLMVNKQKSLKPFLQRLYFSIGTRLTCQRADQLITISSHTKTDLMRLFKISDEKIKVVHLAVGETYCDRENIPGHITVKYGIHKKFILHVGHLKPHKNIHRLIEAYNQLPAQIRDEYSLVLVAKKNFDYPRLFACVQKKGLKNCVIFTDHVPEKDLPSFYQEASLLVLPSLYEGFGLPALEAMASATPVIVAGISSLPEVVADAAICFDPYNTNEISQAMADVLAKEKLRNNLVQKGLQRAKQFTIEKMGAKIHEILIHC